MYLLTPLLFLLFLRSAEPRRGPRSGTGAQSRSRALRGDPGGPVRGRGRPGAVKRQTQQCKEYMEAGEKYLDCQDRQLTTVMQDWPKDINHLLLARNKIQVLRDNMFSQFTQLKSLDLQQNDISMMESQAFSGLSQLTTLLLQHNRLKTATEEVLLPLPRLTYLRLYDNPWSCHCSLDSLVSTLQVPSNRNLGNYAKCTEPPSLRGQKLRKLDVDSLCLDDNHVDRRLVDEMGKKPQFPPTKVKPDAASLCRTYMFPKPLLDCKGKELKSIPSDLPSDIVKMDLSDNNIKQLRTKHFLFAKDLKQLNLSSNSLEHIDTGAFSGLLYLRELDLSNNSLHYFQYSVLEDLYFLRKLSLANNPWICDYNIHYLIYWLKHHPGVSYSGLVCTEPREFRGWAVEEYVKTYNGECPKDRQTGKTDMGQGGSENDAQELLVETDERLPSPLRENKPKRFEIIRLS
ncbi:leucine-rich repeat-containing protein 17 [Lampris incognitus]|uniref:leucine-rich repeat-containing protein 17 n=1 Tax=Lampris incognitus TaxID=2546036 RepID=UPI0024B4BCCB|nr:leucine-rich repeat-containing protein 17 [Lampris incognitus]